MINFSLFAPFLAVTQNLGLPLQACQNIHYLFPESHSAEYAVSLVRFVWYILNYPETGAIVLGERSDYSVGG